jgi:hypothetical protein
MDVWDNNPGHLKILGRLKEKQNGELNQVENNRQQWEAGCIYIIVEWTYISSALATQDFLASLPIKNNVSKLSII